MKAHLIHKHLLGTKFKVTCQGQDQISRSHFRKNGCFGGISVSQTHLVNLSKLIVIIIVDENSKVAHIMDCFLKCQERKKCWLPQCFQKAFSLSFLKPRIVL